MPDFSAKLGLELPKGNETVNRQAYIRNLNIIDLKAAAQSQVDEPFNLLNAVYDATGNKIDITFGPGRVTFLDILVAKTENSIYSIEAPQSQKSYYLYIKKDGSFTHNTSGENIAGAALIWKVATGSPVSYISVEDRRGRLSGTDAQAVVDYINARLFAIEPLGVPKPYFGTVLPEFYLWCDGKTIGDALSGATARANADVHDLFVVLWSAMGLKIYESTGALSARGASAEADWSAHKRLALPQLNGRGLIGLDNLGGISANIVTDPNADILAGTGGAENVTLTVAQMPSHNHGGNTGNQSANHTHPFTIQLRSEEGSGTVAGGSPSGSNDGVYYGTTGEQSADHTHLIPSSGEGQSHNNMSPWIACNWILRF